MKPNNLRTQSFSVKKLSFEFTLFSDISLQRNVLKNQRQEFWLSNLFFSGTCDLCAVKLFGTDEMTNG